VSWRIKKLEAEELGDDRWRLWYHVSDPDGKEAYCHVDIDGYEPVYLLFGSKQYCYIFEGGYAHEFLLFIEQELLGTRLVMSE